MAAIRQLLSQTSYNGDGVQTVWDFSFSGGYLDKAHVKAYTRNTNTGVITNLVISPLTSFIGPFQLSITPAVAAGLELTIYRDTPKDLPLVNFADKAALTEAALDLNANQAVFIAAESSDGLAAALSSVATTSGYAASALTSATSAGASATSATASATSATAASNSSTSAASSKASVDATKAAIDVQAAAIAVGPVQSFNTRAGAVTLTAADVQNTGGAVNKTSATGSALVPSGTTAQRDAAPVYGAQRANSTLNQQEWWNGSAWVPMGGGATGAPGNNVFVENDQTVTGSYTLTAGKNAMTAGPITIATGVTVTIPDGATWSVI
jgi:Phage T7 tail fibre protein